MLFTLRELIKRVKIMNTQNNIIEKDREAEDSKKTIESTVIKLLRTQGKVDVFSFFFFFTFFNSQ